MLKSKLFITGIIKRNANIKTVKSTNQFLKNGKQLTLKVMVPSKKLIIHQYISPREYAAYKDVLPQLKQGTMVLISGYIKEASSDSDDNYTVKLDTLDINKMSNNVDHIQQSTTLLSSNHSGTVKDM